MMNSTTFFSTSQGDSIHVLPDLLSEETYQIINYIFSGYISTIICLIGIVVNLVTCLVFWRQGLRDRMNLCLFCLAMVDLLYLMTFVPVLSVGAWLRLAGAAVAGEYFLKALVGGAGLMYGLRTTSGCYHMIIAVERCVCVVFPLKAASLVGTGTMGVLLAVCFILIQLGYLCIPLKYHVVSVDVRGTTQWRYVPTKMFLDNKEAFLTVEMSVLTVSLPIIMVFVVFVTAVITVIKLKAALKWREKTSCTSREKVGHQTGLTKMILLVSLIFLCTMIPRVCLTITGLLVQEFSASGRYYYLYMATNTIANVCPQFHSSSNFFVYFARSSRFKTELVAMGSCLKEKARQPTSVATSVQQVSVN